MTFESRICKIAGKIGLSFWKLTFLRVSNPVTNILKHKRNSKVCKSIKFGKGVFSTSC